jgi:DnaJ-class molecular chaperone
MNSEFSSLKDTCPTCRGSGIDPWDDEYICSHCDGSGEIDADEAL